MVLLDFADGTHGVTAGEEDDATRDGSQLCGTPAFARWEAPRACANGDRDACRDAVLREVQRRFEAYDVDFTLTRPEAPARYTTLVIAPPDAACTFGQRGWRSRIAATRIRRASGWCSTAMGMHATLLRNLGARSRVEHEPPRP